MIMIFNQHDAFVSQPQAQIRSVQFSRTLKLDDGNLVFVANSRHHHSLSSASKSRAILTSLRHSPERMNECTRGTGGSREKGKEKNVIVPTPRNAV